jgi:hypothetical protein
MTRTGLPKLLRFLYGIVYLAGRIEGTSSWTSHDSIAAVLHEVGGILAPLSRLKRGASCFANLRKPSDGPTCSSASNLNRTTCLPFCSLRETGRTKASVPYTKHISVSLILAAAFL